MIDYAVIVAGGSGARMGTELPKQFLLLNNKPILMHTIEKFYNFNNNIKITLVLPNSQFSYWANLCLEHKFILPHQVIAGGSNRFYSVQNGLNSIDEVVDKLVAIHDGVRPFVSIDTIKRCANEAKLYGNAIPVISINDSIRYIDEYGNKIVNRNNYKAVQTPQVFKLEVLKKSYLQPYSEYFTDDASVAESAGEKINLVNGNVENIKITTPADLIFANALIQNPSY